MTWITTTLRRSLWLVLVVAAGGAAWSWWRDRDDLHANKPAEWPPISPPKAPHPDSPGPASAASFVNALVDAPEARSTDGAGGGWSTPLHGGACPISHPVKANDNSGIFHLPGGRFYDRTKPERCYTTPEAAVADGYRRAKN